MRNFVFEILEMLPKLPVEGLELVYAPLNARACLSLSNLLRLSESLSYIRLQFYEDGLEEWKHLFEAIAESSSLRMLVLFGNEEVAPLFVDMIQKNNSLVTLELINPSPLGKSEYSHPLNLRVVNLCGVVYFQDDNFFRSALQDTDLIALNLYNCLRTDDDMLEVCSSLRNHVNLEIFSSVGDRISDKGLQAICEILSTVPLRILGLRFDRMLGKQAFDQLEVCLQKSQINTLELIFNRTPVPLKPLMMASSIRNLSILLSSADTVRLFEALNSGEMRLERLALSVSEDQDYDNFPGLTEWLSSNQTLEYLGLEAVGLDGSRIIELFQALQKNSTLLELDLSENNLGRLEPQKLRDSLKINSSLLSLNLSCNHLNNLHLEALESCLSSNITLLFLSIKQSADDQFYSAKVYEQLKRNRLQFKTRRTLACYHVLQTRMPNLSKQIIKFIISFQDYLAVRTLKYADFFIPFGSNLP
jgi:hypothetical protein